MKPITYQEAFRVLHPAGFAEKEIDRLYRLRRTYQKSELDQAPLDLHHLRFIQWLIETGRLTDQLPEVKNASPDTPLHQKSQPVFALARFVPPLFRRKE